MDVEKALRGDVEAYIRLCEEDASRGSWSNSRILWEANTEWITLEALAGGLEAVPSEHWTWSVALQSMLVPLVKDRVRGSLREFLSRGLVRPHPAPAYFALRVVLFVVRGLRDSSDFPFYVMTVSRIVASLEAVVRGLVEADYPEVQWSRVDISEQVSGVVSEWTGYAEALKATPGGRVWIRPGGRPVVTTQQRIELLTARACEGFLWAYRELRRIDKARGSFAASGAFIAAHPSLALTMELEPPTVFRVLVRALSAQVSPGVFRTENVPFVERYAQYQDVVADEGPTLSVFVRKFGELALALSGGLMTGGRSRIPIALLVEFSRQVFQFACEQYTDPVPFVLTFKAFVGAYVKAVGGRFWVSGGRLPDGDVLFKFDAALHRGFLESWRAYMETQKELPGVCIEAV